ncbi:LOW QUALITY PROTEIN: hypothetical protein U9M48_035371 [Paspalum notatum var. saurae]|uniref:GH10 domain-containing protein n=1 Tax=Paspalum notatum var. saurae TaxID=547442 RepID=A0AAQ3UAZ6_PASNO
MMWSSSRRTDEEEDAVTASVAGAHIQVIQVLNCFPIGSCITKAGMHNPEYVDIFTKHFDWAVLENELKWYYTEAVQGQVSYAEADELIAFCDRHGKPNAVQQWVRALIADQLRAAVEAWLRGLVSCYCGQFLHYEVNSEMLHDSSFKQRLGDDIDAHMFQETAAIDPATVLFVNDYNEESANDPNVTPEKYVALVTDLQKWGALVGGIGVQGHMTHPVSLSGTSSATRWTSSPSRRWTRSGGGRGRQRAGGLHARGPARQAAGSTCEVHGGSAGQEARDVGDGRRCL